jgi:hypothetical protein
MTSFCNTLVVIGGVARGAITVDSQAFMLDREAQIGRIRLHDPFVIPDDVVTCAETSSRLPNLGDGYITTKRTVYLALIFLQVKVPMSFIPTWRPSCHRRRDCRREVQKFAPRSPNSESGWSYEFQRQKGSGCRATCPVPRRPTV